MFAESVVCQHLVAFAIGVARRGNRAVATVEGGWPERL